MDTIQTITNPTRYNQAVKYIKGCNYGMQLHKLYNIDDLGLIKIIQQDDKFKKFLHKLNKKYYNSIDKHDLKAIIEDVLVDIARNRESIVVNYEQMISYTTKSIENRCKDYLKLKYSQKRGYKDGECLVSSLHKYINDLGELPFADKKSMYEYEEVELMLSFKQEGATPLALQYLELLLSSDKRPNDSQAAEILKVDRRTIQAMRKRLANITHNIIEHY